MGCWAIGGPFWRAGKPSGWGQVEDQESLSAVRRAFDLGINFFDTADVYGTGHSEIILGQGLAGYRQQCVIATKFGNVFVEGTRQVTGRDTSPAYIRSACEASLRRLNTDVIDLYQLHPKDIDLQDAEEIVETLESLVAQGKIRYYGWSTDDPERARLFARGPHCTAIQHTLSLLDDNPAMLEVCERENLASINRGPLGRGMLTGKFSSETKFAADDVRTQWNLVDGKEAARLSNLSLVQDVLCRDGRTLAQAALGWIWGRSNCTIPIPGIKTVLQAEENAGALEFGILSQQQMEEIDRILNRG
jgi:aryl-alcohol dehydrogenase-like predicted oxidoreductase